MVHLALACCCSRRLAASSRRTWRDKGRLEALRIRPWHYTPKLLAFFARVVWGMQGNVGTCRGHIGRFWGTAQHFPASLGEV